MLWDRDGSVHQLPMFFGDEGLGSNHDCALDNRGQVGGDSDLSGDTAFHGFVSSPIPSAAHPISRDFTSLANNISDGGMGASIGRGFNSFRAVV